MPRRWPALLTLLVFTVPAFAQRGGGHGGGMHSGGMRGGSSGGFRGGGFSGSRGGGFNGFRGGGFNGFRGGFNNNRFFGNRFGFNRFSRVGIYPFFYGGFGYDDPYFPNAYPGYASYPSAGYSYNSNPAPVIISQNYYYGSPAAEPAPVARVEEYPPQPAPTAAGPRLGESSLYLIAFKDHTIRAVLAYWANGATLHYVTMEHEQKQTSVASVDRELSERLNRERNVAFGLPR
jgi:hypothetical protein